MNELTLTEREAESLRQLYAVAQQAQERFALAFTMVCAGRDIAEASFQSLDGRKLTVLLPPPQEA